MRDGAVAVAELAVVVALEAGLGVVVGDRERVDERVGALDLRAQEFVKAVLVDALARDGAAEAAEAAAGKRELPQIHHAAVERQSGAEIRDHVPQVLVLGRAVRDDDDVLALRLGGGRQPRLIDGSLRFGRACGRRDEQAVFAGEHQLVEEIPRLALSALGEQVVHVGRQAAHDVHPEVEAVLLHPAVRRDVIEVLGRGDLAGEFSGEVDAVGLDELDEPVQLIGRDERVDGVAEQQKVSLFQLRAQRGKILLVAPDALAHRQDGKRVLRVQRMQVQRRVGSGGVFALGAGVQHKNVHGCSSSSRSSRVYQPISNSAAAMPYSMV